MLPILTLSLFSLLGLGASAAPGLRMSARQTGDVTPPVKLLIGGGPTGTVYTADFDGSSFKIGTKNTVAGAGASWLLFRKTDSTLYAVDENSETLRRFTYNPATSALDLLQKATGSSGVVHLAFNGDETRLVGAAYGKGNVDVWDISGPGGELKLLKQIPSTGTLGPNPTRQTAPHPHQVLLEPSGRYFAVNDLGTDSIMIIDSADDAFNVVNNVKAANPGCGPRHGAFYPPAGGDVKKATHYFVVCEILNLIEVFTVTYDAAGKLDFAPAQTISTFGPDAPPANASSAAAGELQLSSDALHVYVSNRLTGGATDNIAHFEVGTCSDSCAVQLRYVDTISSAGLVPRMFSLSLDGSLVFSTNQDGENGLVAFSRDAQSGRLSAEPTAKLPLSEFGQPTFGPQFVQEI